MGKGKKERCAKGSRRDVRREVGDINERKNERCGKGSSRRDVGRGVGEMWQGK
jgi:hypothetical protein